MAGGNWTVSARVLFSTNGAAVLSMLTKQAALANATMSKYKTSIDAAKVALQKLSTMPRVGLPDVEAQFARLTNGVRNAEVALSSYERAATRTAAANARLKWGAGFAMGGAAVLAAASAAGISDAAKFERSLTGVQIATQANPAMLQALKSQIVEVSGISAQSAVTIAEEMKKAAQVAFKDPRALAAPNGIFTQMAKFADVRYIATGENPVENVATMAQFAHLFQAYGPGGMSRMLDLMAKLQMNADTTPQQLVTQARMFVPGMVGHGVDEKTIFDLMTIGAQLGFMKNRGGTALNNLLLGLSNAPMLTSSLTKAKRQGASDLGLFDAKGLNKFLGPNGHVELQSALDFMFQRRQQMIAADPRMGASRWSTDIFKVFGKEAQRFVEAISTEETRKQIARNRTSFGNMPGVEGQWKTYSNNFLYQWNAFKTNLQNAIMLPFLPLLPELTSKLNDFNARLRELNRWLAANPDAAKNIAKGIIAGTVALTAAGVYMGSKMVWNAMTLNAALNRLTLAMIELTAATNVAAGETAAAGAAASRAGLLIGTFTAALGPLIAILSSTIFLQWLGAVQGNERRKNGTFSEDRDQYGNYRSKGSSGSALGPRPKFDASGNMLPHNWSVQGGQDPLHPAGGLMRMLRDHPPKRTSDGSPKIQVLGGLTLTINGTQLSQAELTKAVADALDPQHILAKLSAGPTLGPRLPKALSLAG
jgi:hypothetical protein